MANFSIFLHKSDDGNYYEFGYYEHTSNNFDGDMSKLAKEQRNIEWLKTCYHMQIPFEGEKDWAIIEQIFFNKYYN